MDTVVALLSAVPRALRGMFDMALMAVGVAPTNVPVTDAVCSPLDESGGAVRHHDRNPASGLPMLGRHDSASNLFGFNDADGDAPLGSAFNEWCYRKDPD